LRRNFLLPLKKDAASESAIKFGTLALWPRSVPEDPAEALRPSAGEVKAKLRQQNRLARNGSNMNHIARYERMFYSDSDVMKRKPIRQKGQDIRTLPTYTIPEAAAFLAMPTRTLQAWYSGKNPLLVATGQVGSIALLSFRDLEESYKVHVLRSKYAFSFPKLREALVVAREESHRDHPLLESEFSALPSVSE
jgi:hypothetical protein